MQLSLSGFGIVLMYLFQENIIQLNLNPVRFAFICILIVVHVVFQWLITLYNNPTGEYWFFLWFCSLMPYYIAGIYVFAFFGLPIWIRTYKKTHAKVFILYIFAYCCIVCSDLCLFYTNFQNNLFLQLDNPITLFIDGFGNAIGLIGLFLLYSLIAVNYLALYRLPQDNYALIIANHSGIVLNFYRFKAERPIALQEDLIAGFLSAVNSMFDETLHSRKKINLISSGDAAIYMEHGTRVSVAFLAQNISGLVAGEMKRFLNDYEKEFEKDLARNQSNVGVFRRAKSIVQTRFPFFEIIE
jgi:hypothetical protein